MRPIQHVKRIKALQRLSLMASEVDLVNAVTSLSSLDKAFQENRFRAEENLLQQKSALQKEDMDYWKLMQFQREHIALHRDLLERNRIQSQESEKLAREVYEQEKVFSEQLTTWHDRLKDEELSREKKEDHRLTQFSSKTKEHFQD